MYTFSTHFIFLKIQDFSPIFSGKSRLYWEYLGLVYENEDLPDYIDVRVSTQV